jgi:hypothetical protein
MKTIITLEKVIITLVALLLATPAFAGDDVVWVCHKGELITGGQTTEGGCYDEKMRESDAEWIAYRDKTGDYAPTQEQIDAAYTKVRCDMALLSVIGPLLTTPKSADQLCRLQQAAE